MKLRRLFRSLRDCKDMRKKYVIKPKVIFEVDDTYYYFCFIPTIGFMPWVCRRPDTSVFEIWWLNMHLCLGIWEAKKNERQSDGC